MNKFNFQSHSNYRRVLKACISAVACVLALISQPIWAAYESRAGLKVASVSSDVYGNLYMRFTTPFAPVAGCPGTELAFFPKINANNNLVTAESTLARIQATAQSAMARNACVVVAFETTFGCQWAYYPIGLVFEELK